MIKEKEEIEQKYHKLHLAISPSVLQQLPQSQQHPKALKKTF